METQAKPTSPPSIAARTLSIKGAHIGLLALAIGLAGCGSTPNHNSSYQQAPQVVSEPRESVAQLLAKAKRSSDREGAPYLLKAAQQLIDKGDNSWAQNLLKNIEAGLLRDKEFIDYSLLLGSLAMEDGSYFLARDTLTQTRLQQLSAQLDNEQRQQLGELKATLFTLLGDTRAGVEERLALSHWIDAGQQTANQQALWQTLMMENPEQLFNLSQESSDSLQQGWYQLALIAKSQQGSIEQQRQQVEQWRLSHPLHPAAQELPKDLQQLSQLIASQPRQVAILLPTQGKLAKAGQAIRDGFMAAYYQALSTGAPKAQIRFFDTSTDDITQVYQQAVSNGAELVIGPLDKNRVKRLNEQAELSVPVLAMNYIEPPSNASTSEYNPMLFQFGLAVEDEARQCAQRAHLEGHKRALILAPQSPWGNRGAQAFMDEWQKLGGDVVGDERFTGNGDYSRVIENSLQLNQSKYRHRTLQRILGKNLEFEPRRRQDVDMIFLLGRSNQAKQVKPTLAFHYASKIPVYATSHIYNGEKDIKANRDLNNIRFTALPWFMQHEQGEREAVDQYVSPNPAYQQLYALGADSFRIYPRLKQLAQLESLQIQGGTGKLQMLSNRQLARLQDWAVIRNGRAVALPSVASSLKAAGGR